MSWNDWRSGSTNPVYNGLGPGTNNYGKHGKVPGKLDIDLSFEEAQESVKDSCANCLHRWDRTKTWNYIDCLTWGQKATNSRFSYLCDWYEADPTLDKARW